MMVIDGEHASHPRFISEKLMTICVLYTGLLAIYSYTMFNFLMNDCLEGNSKRFVFTIRSNNAVISHHRPQHYHHHQQLVRSSWPITNITTININPPQVPWHCPLA